VKEARSIGVTKHINAGGGVFSRADVRKLKRAGADSVSVGTVAMHRPWRLKGIVDEAYKQFSLVEG
jgi:phosphoribosylformimino-5-aminoimidazole carboxamide ribonucleotide (ProFAR) isomerase